MQILGLPHLKFVLVQAIHVLLLPYLFHMKELICDCMKNLQLPCYTIKHHCKISHYTKLYSHSAFCSRLSTKFYNVCENGLCDSGQYVQSQLLKYYSNKLTW